MEFSPEQLKKAAGARSPAELLELASSGGMSMTLEEAEKLFTKLHPPAGELADDELEAVSGGGCGGGGVSSGGGQVPLIPGQTKLSLGNQSHCMDCGHQDTFYYQSGHYSGGVLIVSTMSCPSCKALHQVEGGTVTLKKKPDGSVQRATSLLDAAYA